MKKFNLKKSAKYIICTLLTLTVVATVVFLPRFYYSVTDNRDSVGNTAETFKLTADITTSSGGEFLKLVSNEDTVWVLQNNAPKAETVISYAKKAISNLANSLKDTNLFSNIAGYIPQFFTFDSCSGYKLTMRGTLDGNVIVSSDFMFVTCNYAKEGERYGLNMTRKPLRFMSLTLIQPTCRTAVPRTKFRSIWLFRTATVMNRSCPMHS